MPDPVVKTRAAALAEVKKPAVEGRLFAILDCCDAPVIYSKVRTMDESQAACLYRGKLDPKVQAEAPYLVRVTPDLVDWLQKTVWKKPWGIFVVANTDLRSLRKHFRRFLTVANDKGEAVYFRYYDPRVLSIYLPTCTDEELRIFLGPVLAYGVGDPKVSTVAYFFREGSPVSSAPRPQGAILRMRPEQMDAFLQALRKRFEDRIVLAICRLFPGQWKKDGEKNTRERIRNGIDRAAQYNIRGVRDVRRYIYLIYRQGDDFDAAPWARAILSRNDLQPDQMVASLYAALEAKRAGRDLQQV